ncbi:hypothetical protein GCM10008106_31250 [Mongoliitalea lutea]|uniref:Lipocalin-like domain-containing protein n=2 Tax=Mongoliitalea lutea TaxID=849756 RepID=A0A8J3CZT3_9BACT|nr:hypothetical protein GCM10008106_31250 [Mongoliitalea lutea]
MKHMKLILTLLGFVFLVACAEKEPAFNPQLVGTWEIVHFNEPLNTNSITAYTFNGDGTYSWAWAFRNPGERTNFGYQLIWNGTFRTTQDQISFRVEEMLDAPIGIPSSFFVPREEMVQRNYTPGAITNRRFMLSADRSTLTILADDEMASDEVYTRAKR